jgi:hypothetical protein
MDLPAKLYKYRSLATVESRERNRAILREHQIWFARASSFNDPFDCNFDVPSDLSDEVWSQRLGAMGDSVRGRVRGAMDRFREAARRYNEQHADDVAEPNDLLDRLRVGVLKYNKRAASRAPAAQAATPTPEEPAAKGWTIEVKRDGKRVTLAEAFNPIERRRVQDIKAALDQQVGVLTLSRTPKDILLWAHYAGGHDGICLEFDVQALDGAFPHLGAVHYSKKYLEVAREWVNLLQIVRIDRQQRGAADLLRLALEVGAMEAQRDTSERHVLDVARQWFFTKSRHWSYEREWRSIAAETGLRSFPAAALRSVTVGLVRQQENLAFVRECIKDRSPRPRLRVVEKVAGEFRLRLCNAD